MGYDLPDDYVDVAARIREFRDKHPEGSLQQHDLQFVRFADKDWCVYTAAAYRTPDDPRPGMGTAWEPVPGRTPFTKDSELQNAETAAWGRAIVAVLASETKRIASADEVRNRQADRDQAPPPQEPPEQQAAKAHAAMERETTAENVRYFANLAHDAGLMDVALDFGEQGTKPLRDYVTARLAELEQGTEAAA